MKPKRQRRRDLNYTEKNLMSAMGLKDVRKLDRMLAAPISQRAADHSEPPDEEYELFDRAIEWLEVRESAQERFEALAESRYLN